MFLRNFDVELHVLVLLLVYFKKCQFISTPGIFSLWRKYFGNVDKYQSNNTTWLEACNTLMLVMS